MTFPAAQGPLNIQVDPDVVNQFAMEYLPVADHWDAVAVNLQLIVDTFREHASLHVEGGQVAPLMAGVDQIILEKMQTVMNSVTSFAEHIRSDVELMKTMAASMQALSAETAAAVERTS